MAGNLPGGLDLGDNERQVCQLLRSATGGGHSVLHRIEQRDDLLDLHAERDQLLLRTDKSRLAKRRVLGELAEFLHLLVDGLLAAEHGFQGRVRVLLHRVVRQAGAQSVLAQSGHAYRGCSCSGCRDLQGGFRAASQGVEHTVNDPALSLHICGETLSPSGCRVHPGCEALIVDRDFCDQGAKIKLTHSAFRLSLFGLLWWRKKPGEAAIRNVEQAHNQGVEPGPGRVHGLPVREAIKLHEVCGYVLPPGRDFSPGGRAVLRLRRDGLQVLRDQVVLEKRRAIVAVSDDLTNAIRCPLLGRYRAFGALSSVWKAWAMKSSTAASLPPLDQ